MPSILEYLSPSEAEDVMERGGVLDVSTSVHDGMEDCSGRGDLLTLVPGLYILSDVPIPAHLCMEGPLRGRGAAWWGVPNKGAVFKNTVANTCTLRGETGSHASINTSIRGVTLWSETTTDAHIYLPDGQNSLLLQSLSFLGGAHAIKTEGDVYDITMDLLMAQGQTAATISKQAHGGKGITLTRSYLRGGATQAILLASGGSGAETAWTMDDLWIVGYEGDGVAAVDVSAASIRGCTMKNIKFEGNNGTNSWCAFIRGDAWVLENVTCDAGTKGIEADYLYNSVFLPNRFSSLSGFGLKINSTCSNINLMPQTATGGIDIIDEST